MTQKAVGALETKGFPGILAAADAMVKAGRITLTHYSRAGSARFFIVIRGDISEVKVAMDAGVTAVEKVPGGALESWVIVPRPHENVVSILPIDYTKDSEPFRDAVEGTSMLSSGSR
jgi:microcompartment protein CcmL/EutN